MERLRVGIDVRPLQSAGGSAERGIGRYVTDLVVGLRDHAPEIEPVLLGRSGHALPAAFLGIEAVPVDGPIFAEAPKPWFARVPKLRSSSRLWGPHHRKLRAELAAGMTRAVAGARLDVLHFPTALDVGSYPEGEFAVPQVRTFLDAIPFRLPEIHLDRWPEFMRAYYREQLAGLRQARIVVAISHASAQDAREIAGIPEEHLRVVYPTVGDRYRDASPATPPFGLTAGRYVLFCSVPDPHKNPAVAIEAFAAAELPADVRLVFVAPPDRMEMRALRALAEARGLGNRFLVMGAVPEPVMPALFAGALALISPSRIEGFGLPAAQAMAAGTAVVASDRSALGEIVGGRGFAGRDDEAVGPVAAPDDASGFARGLHALLDGPTLRAYEEAGRRRAVAFRPEVVARALAAVYFEAAGRSVTAPPASTRRS